MRSGALIMKKYIVISIGCLLLATLGCIEEISTPTTTPATPVWKEKSLVSVDKTINLSAGEYWSYHVPKISQSSARNLRYEIVFREEHLSILKEERAFIVFIAKRM